MNAQKILTVEELQQDVAELLDYLYSTHESQWDLMHVRTLIMRNMQRFDDNLKYYNTPLDTAEYVKLVYSKSDVTDLIGTMTRKHTALASLVLKEEYRNQADVKE
ncbi:MAG: hypothetical protein JKY52_18910 [Flavobacteriales bacterium]|nr:hypothetical protein [Flavobacteriales bacterium]